MYVVLKAFLHRRSLPLRARTVIAFDPVSEVDIAFFPRGPKIFQIEEVN